MQKLKDLAPSVRWQTSQSCVRNFRSKINGLWFLCGWNSCWCSFGSCVCWGLIDNLYDFFWRHALRTFMCGSLRSLFLYSMFYLLNTFAHRDLVISLKFWISLTRVSQCYEGKQNYISKLRENWENSFRPSLFDQMNKEIKKQYALVCIYM